MKVGILTLPLHTNYGGILQAYALQTILERMGHKVEVISPKQEQKSSLKRLLAELKRCLIKSELGWKINSFIERRRNGGSLPVNHYTQKFICRNINGCYVTRLSKLNSSEFDCIIVGSDQIWRPRYLNENFFSGISDAYLGFAEAWNIHRIAYAASFGTDDWEYSDDETLRCGSLIKLFDAVSVRERAAVKLCKDKFGVDAKHVLDPTMLLDSEDYIKLFKKEKTPKSSGNLLTYILDPTPEKQAVVERIAGERGLKPFETNSQVENRHLNCCIQPPVEQWLRGFSDAEYVVTDSFHACVFSILFRKPFTVYGNVARGMSRFYSLLGMFGLEDRLIASAEDYHDCSDINYDKVCDKLKNWRQLSMDFLNNGLDNRNEK